ncbi:MAG: DEAD/DEAH box helicase [Streptosporangiaceae bacterium]
MTSPAERYTAFRRRQAEALTALASFSGLYSFSLDPFQVDACRALEDGEGALVAAPTGAGKTVVGEFAVHLALARGQKCFYTTPIKALSNQKYTDLVHRYGPDAIGLLTGDNTLNGEAPIVVMTTEVLRNMLYAGSPTLAGLGYVVLDEVHYLADRFRGGVWEEVIIHLPEAVSVVALSATVSNAEEFGDWLVQVRGATRVVVEEHRPVPLWQHMLAGPRLYDLFVDGQGKKVNPDLLRISREDARLSRDRFQRSRGRYPRRTRRMRVPSRVEVVERLDRAALLPAITFIFSRVGCDQAVRQCLLSGLWLTTPEERDEIKTHVEEACAELPDGDLAALGYDEWLAGLERGVAAHHAGMLPTFKEVVEALFTRGLVKAVFATETLALGINMPARTVVLERLVKFNGETHADITPGEYTQLTGRAGRRGIDVEGHAVVLYQPGVDPTSVAGLASTRTYPLRSSFRPSYNMAVNLVGQVGRESARDMLGASFAQFQADRSVLGLARQVHRNEEGLAGYREAMTCHLGDFGEYDRLRRALAERESSLGRERREVRRAEAARSLERLRVGDVIDVPAGRRAGLAVVLDPGTGTGTGSNGPRPTVLTADRKVRRLSLVDFPVPVDAVERVRVPKSFDARSPRSRRDLASTVRNKVGDRSPTRADVGPPGLGDDAEVARLRKEVRRHPCHGCADRDQHVRWAERYARLRKETEGLRRRVEGRTHVIARTFDRVCTVLERLGYLDGEAVTAEGARLARLYTELDLLAAECLRHGVWEGLSSAELAACVSALVYESRRPEEGPPRVPGGRAESAIAATARLWGELDGIEKDHRLSFLREPDAGFAWAAYRWARGHSLDTVLSESGTAAGDFVRHAKQLIDLLGQIADAADEPLHAVTVAAIDQLRRGVVAYSSVG